MNKSAFLKLIKQVSDISDQQQSELEQVAATFPYCQTAHLLLAKSAYDRGSMLSTQRLRRASAYATDRQLLKRLIYASPVLEPVYDEAPEETTFIEETESVPFISDITEEVDTAVETESSVTEAVEELVAIPESEVTTEEETLEEVYSPVTNEHSAYPTEDSAGSGSETPDAEVDSELALLFTFNSISSSSTDLLSYREEDSVKLEEVEQEAQPTHHAEAVEALLGLEEAQQTDEEAFSEDLPDAHQVEEDAIPVLQDELIQTAPSHEVPPAEKSETDDELFVEEAETEQESAENAEINYSFDEIDHLYAQDALGYWMGSSRMGEMLQLKDDYTRMRPQSFHPELILEYSKTHELEKAIQPTAHVLSKQLDIIDQFLKLNPRLKTMANLKLKPEPQEDLSLKSSKIKKGMASESLANIFIKQGKPKKAVKIYEQLILKYPEKKSYFAEQIEKLQNIT